MSLRGLRFFGVLIAACLLSLLAGYKIGVYRTHQAHYFELADNAVAGLHRDYRVLKLLATNQMDGVKKLLVAQAESNLAEIVRHGHLVDRPGHLEYRSVLLREYKKFRKANSSLYRAPSYLSLDELNNWTKEEKIFEQYLEENSAAEGVTLKPLKE